MKRLGGGEGLVSYWVLKSKGRRDRVIGVRETYEFDLTASRSGLLFWLMMQPIRRPLAPKSLKVPTVRFLDYQLHMLQVADLAHPP